VRFPRDASTPLLALERARRRITIGLFASQAAFGAGSVAAFTVMSMIAAQLGGPVLAGLPGALGLLGRASAAYPMGWLMDRAGRRTALALGYVLGTAGAALASVAVIGGSLPGFLAGSVLFGMARGAADQSRFVAAEVHPPDRRGRVIGLIVFAGTVGAVGGPLLVGVTSDWASGWGINELTGPWLATVALMALATLVSFGLLRPDPREISRALGASGQNAAQTERPARPLRTVFAAAQVRLAVAAMVVGQAVMVMLMTMMPLHMYGIHETTQSISVVMTAHTLGMFGLSGLTGRLVDRIGRAPVIALGALQLVAASALAPFADGLAQIVPSMFLLGLGWNFTFVAGSSLLVDQLRLAERGRAQGVSEAAVAVAAGAGGIGSGPVFALGGVAWVGALGLAATLGLVSVLAWFARSSRTVAAVPT